MMNAFLHVRKGLVALVLLQMLDKFGAVRLSDEDSPGTKPCLD